MSERLPVVLSAEELLAFLSAIDNLRDRVLLTLLYSAGLRRPILVICSFPITRTPLVI